MDDAVEARRLAVGLVIAIHDGDRKAFSQVVEGVGRAELAGVVKALAELVDAGLLVSAREPAEARSTLTDFALRLATE